MGTDANGLTSNPGWKEERHVGMIYNTTKANIYLQTENGVPDCVLKHNIPKQKEKNPNNTRTHPKRPDTLAVRSGHTTNLYWHFRASSPSISYAAKGALCCSLVGVSVQVSQLIAPYHILLCKTGLVMVVKQL